MTRAAWSQSAGRYGSKRVRGFYDTRDRSYYLGGEKDHGAARGSFAIVSISSRSAQEGSAPPIHPGVGMRFYAVSGSCCRKSCCPEDRAVLRHRIDARSEEKARQRAGHVTRSDPESSSVEEP